MPANKQKPVEDKSSSDDEFGGIDLARFANPNFAREFKAKLPQKIRDRVKALEALDEDYKAIKIEMSVAIDAAELEFQRAIKPQAAARLDILSGNTEPTSSEIENGVPDNHKDRVVLDGASTGTKGIHKFWLEVLQHHIIIREFITENDKEALKHVTDISCASLEAPEEGFTITFTFNDNSFFTNQVLSKTFNLSRSEDDVVLNKTLGTKIEWKDGKNLGLHQVTKKVKSKAQKGKSKFVTTEEPCETFFDFFSTEQDADEDEWLAMAEGLKDKIIPFAVDYFTGEAANGESDLEDEDYDEEDEEDEEEPEKNTIPSSSRGRGGYTSAAPAQKQGGRGRGAGQQDCKQQ